MSSTSSQRSKYTAATRSSGGAVMQTTMEADSAKGKGRSAKSLHYLASEFVNLVTSQPDETIDVLYAADQLKVEKRRIYDITNALIGANVLQKQGKSSYKWIGGRVSSSKDSDDSSFASERTAIEDQIAEVEKGITDLTDYLNRKYYGKPNVVLTTEELVASCKAGDSPLNRKIVLAISAPAGTDVYVTNQEKGRDQEVFLSAPEGEIRTYLLPSVTDQPHVYPPSIPNTPMGTQTPRNQQGGSSGIGAITPSLDFSQAENSQIMDFSAGYDLNDMFIY